MYCTCILKAFVSCSGTNYQDVTKIFGAYVSPGRHIMHSSNEEKWMHFATSNWTTKLGVKHLRSKQTNTQQLYITT